MRGLGRLSRRKRGEGGSSPSPRAFLDAPFFFVSFLPSPAWTASTVEPQVRLPHVRASPAAPRQRALTSVLAEMASIRLSHSSQSFIAARPLTLALALGKARTLFPDLVNIALTA